MAQIDDDDITIISRPSQPKLTVGAARHCRKCGLTVADSTSVCPQDGTQIFEAPEELLAAKYEFMTVTGSGGMSVVYKARRQGSGEVVAIKMMHSLLMNDQALKRFQQEAKAITSLRHPNIINVHDFGVSEHGQPYMVMDFIDGNTLADVIKEKGGLTVAESLHRFIQLCDALHHAHEVGVLHRDLKPSNIMISNRDGNFADARIVDFGIAKLLDKENEGSEDGHLTRTGELFGSPLYMSPEQCRGSQVDARSDIYSMGCVMYETLTGQPPLKGASMVETFVLQMSEVPASMSEACPDKRFPEELEAVIAKALAKDPDDRFQTMTELEYALMQIQPDQLNQAQGRAKRQIQIPKIPKTAIVATASAITGFVFAAFLIPPIVHHQEKAHPKEGIENTNQQRTSKPLPQEKINVADLAQRNRKIRKGMTGGDTTLADALSGDDLGMSRVDLSEAEPPIHDSSAVLLGKLKSLKDLTLDDNQIGDRTLAAIQYLPITKLLLRRTMVTDEGVKYRICNVMYPRLEELALSGCELVGSDSIKSIGEHLHVLKKLWISELKIDDESFAKLKGITDLQHLYADQTAIGDTGVGALSDMTSLIELQLNFCQIGDRGISQLTKLKSLRQLGISYTLVTDRMIPDLLKLQYLQELDLGGTLITSNGLARLSGLRYLRSLGLYNTNMTDNGLLNLANFQSLNSLNLANTKISSAGVAGIRKLQNLQWLDIGGTEVNDKGLEKLGTMPNLKTLILYDCPITIAGVRKLQNTNPNLHIKLLHPLQNEEGFYEDPRNFKEYPPS